MNNKDTIKQFFDERANIWDEICYHDPEKMDKILKICDIKQGEKIMDVGCGTGVLTKKLIETQATKIVGIDLSDKMIEVAKSNLMDDRVTFIADDFYNFVSEQFDCIIIYSAYPHFIEKAEFAEKMHELLKPGGRFIIAHSQSKESINSCHNKKASNISTLLQQPEIEFESFTKWFQPKLFIDNEKMYIIVGQK
jgi:ubiquinone/menaquinone biosynthesis C-methylase UbiE